MLWVMENAEAFNRGDLTDFSQVGTRAIDDRTLEIRLRGPMPYFPSMLKHYAWFPVNPKVIEQFGGMTNRLSQWTRTENHVGNGPFKLAEWRTNQIIRVVRSPSYWDAETVRLNEIHFLPIEDASTEERSFLAGQLHYTNTVPPDRIAGHRMQNPHLLRMEPYLGTYFFRFNTTRPPLDNPLVREALTLAIDQEGIVNQITQGGQLPASGFTPKGMLGYPTPEMIAFNADRARQLLAQAGYPEGRGFPNTLSILFNTSESHRRIAEALQAMWRRELGINVTLTNQEWKVYIDSQVNLQYDISRAGWIGDYMDPITFLSMWMTGDGNNNTGWSNLEFDRLINLAQQTGSAEERYNLMLQAERILLTELPIAPIYWYTRIYLLDPRVRGWHPKLLDNRPYKYIYFDLDEAN
jgi:oligopeptide transport system substrate-binding protein